MHTFFNAVIFAFKELLSFKIMKPALIIGLITSAIWIYIGFLFWDNIISFSTIFLDLVPFSMIRSDGAWMLSTFLWVQLVLVTYALVFAFFGNIIINIVSKNKHASLSLVVVILSAIFWTIVWYFKGDYIYDEFLQLLTWLPFETIEKSMSYLIGIYFIYNAIILSTVFITSAFSQSFLVSLKDTSFPSEKLIEDHEIKTIAYTLRDTAIFIVASIIAFPLLFIPIVNFIVQIILWVWLIKDTFTYDTASLLIEDINKEKLKEYRVAIWGFSILGAFFNFIPVFNMFGPYFSELAMFYYLKEQRHNKKKY